jgi:hypothetical protein
MLNIGNSYKVNPSSTNSAIEHQVVVDIEAQNSNPISRGLLYLKKAASYAITATGLSTKACIVGANGLISLSIFALLVYAHEETDDVKDDNNFVHTLIFSSAGVCLALASLGAKKAGDLIDSFMEQSSQLSIKIAKGTVYLLTVGLVAYYGAEIVDEIIGTELAPEEDSLTAILGLPFVVGLSTLGSYHAINLIHSSEQNLQDKVKKIQ